VKILSSMQILNVNGGDRISFTYDEIDDTTGRPISQNNKDNVFVVDQGLASNIAAIRSFIASHYLQ